MWPGRGSGPRGRGQILTEIRVRSRAELPLVLRDLWRVMQQSHDADGVIGDKVLEYVVAVRQALGEDLHDLEGQVEDGGVVRLGWSPELRVLDA